MIIVRNRIDEELFMSLLYLHAEAFLHETGKKKQIASETQAINIFVHCIFIS